MLTVDNEASPGITAPADSQHIKQIKPKKRKRRENIALHRSE